MNTITLPNNLNSQASPIEVEVARLKINQALRRRYELVAELLALGHLTPPEALALIQSKTAEKHIARIQQEEKEKKLRILLLTNIEGIDIPLAEDLLDEFGSLKAIASATPEELAIVPDIDKNKAKEIARRLPKLMMSQESKFRKVRSIRR